MTEMKRGPSSLFTYPTPIDPPDRELSGEEHATRAMLIGERFFDSKTMTYRYRSPEGSHYTVGGAIDALTLAPLERGEVTKRERAAYHGKTNNTVTLERLGLR